MNLKSLGLVSLVALSAVAAQAFPIAAAGTEGFSVIVSSTDDIIAKYEGNSAAYSNNLYLVQPGSDLFIFNNHASAVGSTVNLGSFAVGTELIFRLHVTNTGYSYYTGPSGRNPDGDAHARVETNWAPGTTLVSFEDLYDGPFAFNDLSFSFTNTVASPTPTVPDGFATVGGLGLVLLGLAAVRRSPARR